MYRNNARYSRDMVSARMLISKRVTKALNFRKVLENEGFGVSKSGPSVKIKFGSWGFRRIFWSKVKHENDYYTLPLLG